MADIGRFEEALAYAARAHRHQRMKGGSIPYVAHLLGVASITLMYGGDEEAAIIALLHDVLEDTDAAPDDLEQRFGPRVRRGVELCSDTQVRRKPAWRERKERHLRELETAPNEVLLVYASDKLQNARSLLKDYRTEGERLWDRFNAGRDETFWYYRSCLDLFRRRGVVPALSDELERTLDELQRLALT
jgi:(p)ppGpp synthase/HD superfamily hydrolase